MKDYWGNHNGNRFIVSDSYDRGTCVCGKEHIQLITIVFDQPVKVRTYNNRTATGKMFQFGNECIDTFTIDGEAENVIVQSKEIAHKRKQSSFFSHSDLHQGRN